jgi:hypothetical protein
MTPASSPASNSSSTAAWPKSKSPRFGSSLHAFGPCLRGCRGGACPALSFLLCSPTSEVSRLCVLCPPCPLRSAFSALRVLCVKLFLFPASSAISPTPKPFVSAVPTHRSLFGYSLPVSSFVSTHVACHFFLPLLLSFLLLTSPPHPQYHAPPFETSTIKIAIYKV